MFCLDVSKRMHYFIAVYTIFIYSVFALLSGYTFTLIIETAPSGKNTDLTHTLAISTQSLFLMQEFLYLFATWKESDYVFEHLEEWNKLQVCRIHLFILLFPFSLSSSFSTTTSSSSTSFSISYQPAITPYCDKSHSYFCLLNQIVLL